MGIRKHYMRLQPGPSADIKNERKQMEYRLYDKKRSYVDAVEPLGLNI